MRPALRPVERLVDGSRALFRRQRPPVDDRVLSEHKREAT
jgi:hypothetical protein